MITAIRTANAIPGKIGEAVMWGKEVATIAERITGKKATISISFGGPAGGIAWTYQFDNAGQVEDALSKLMVDREYLTAITKAESLLVPGSVQDQMWRQV